MCRWIDGSTSQHSYYYIWRFKGLLSTICTDRSKPAEYGINLLVDECIFHRGEVIFILYVDDGIFVGKND